MINQFKVSTRLDLKLLVDTAMVAMGIIAGSIVALLSLWLWLEYRADPNHALLALLSSSFVSALPAPVQTWFGREAHLMGLPLTGDTKAYWYMARSGGVVAYVLLWLSVVWGLILSTKITNGRIPAPIAYGLHEFLSIGAMLFAGWHSLVLLGDRYINFSLFHLVIPFSAPYEPFWTGLGTLGLYLTTLLTGSFYIRRQIGQKAWRALHYLTFGAYGLVLMHGLMAGSDTKLAPIQIMYLATGSIVLFLIYFRLFTLKVRGSK